MVCLHWPGACRHWTTGPVFEAWVEIACSVNGVNGCCTQLNDLARNEGREVAKRNELELRGGLIVERPDSKYGCGVCRGSRGQGV